MDVPAELAALRRRACAGQVGGFRPPDDPLTSWLGAVRAAAPGEPWPRQDGEPMHALLQLAVGELPVVPDALAGAALLALFIGPRRLPIDAPNGEHWCLRTYASLGDLVPLDEPERPTDPKLPKGTTPGLRPFPVRWAETEDWPSRDDVPRDLLDVWDESIDFDEAHTARHGLKVGGWPATVQSELWWNGADDVEFVLQVDSDPKTGFGVGFAGLVYIGRRRGSGDWVLDTQSM